MTEERLTKNVIKWLKINNWEIICYDFPQSGTGISLHPNPEVRLDSKNKGGIIPDIVAYRYGVVVFFENKDRFFKSDFEKVKFLHDTTIYSKAINKLLKNYKPNKIYYGVGGPSNKLFIPKAIEKKYLVDFIIAVNNTNVEIVYERVSIFNHD